MATHPGGADFSENKNSILTCANSFKDTTCHLKLFEAILEDLQTKLMTSC